jgi:hypothetical protein
MEVNEPQENYKTGFIAIYRSLKKHWIWKDPIKFQWWIDILLTVNYYDKTVNIGYELLECKRGQSIQSLSNWADQWNVSKDTARNYLNLLQKDGMIILENMVKTTRITVCNYDSYQINLHVEQTISKRKANDKQTQPDPNNKENKENKVNKRNKKDFIPPILDEVKTYFQENGYKEETADKFFKSYSVNDWKDSNDKPIKNWKQKAINVWFKDENKIPSQQTNKKKFTVKYRLGESKTYEVETLQQAKELYQQNTGVLNIDEIYQV